MKRSVLIAFMLVLSASMAFAQAGSIDIFSDLGFTDCNVSDAAPALVPIYIVHTNTPGASAVQFKVDYSQVATMSIVGEVANPPFILIGSTATGASFAYGSCYAGPMLVVTINLFGSGLSEPCSYISIVPDPQVPSGKVEGVDCAVNRTYPTAGQAIVNPTPDCQCTTPVRETTWGGVKALYN